jgi:hypothetical protein
MTADVSEDLSSEAQLVTQTVLRVTQAVRKMLDLWMVSLLDCRAWRCDLLAFQTVLFCPVLAR